MKRLILGILILGIVTVSADERCDIGRLNNEFFLVTGNEYEGSYGVSFILDRIESLLKDGDCTTGYDRECFYHDSQGMRDIGINAKSGLRTLGTGIMDKSFAYNELKRVKSLGLCNKIIEL